MLSDLYSRVSVVNFKSSPQRIPEMFFRARVVTQEIVRLILLIPFLYIYSFFVRMSRYLGKKPQPFIGFGPLPINLNHSRSCNYVGLRAESYVTHLYSLGGTPDFRLFSSNRFFDFLIRFFCIPYLFAVSRYSHLAFYFDCGPLGNGTIFLWRFESRLLRVAGVKTILMPYGADVHSLKNMKNQKLADAYMLDYPNHWKKSNLIEARIGYWSQNADFIIAGCDWVDYLPKWDKLVLSHFAIDFQKEKHEKVLNEDNTLRILHAPNHRNLKGTSRIEEAVTSLRSKGLDIELTLLSGVPQQKVLAEIGKHDLVVDQLVVGWYAQFALEALVSGVPTICFLKQEYIQFYSDLITKSQSALPFINANLDNIEEVIRDCYFHRDRLHNFSEKGLSFVKNFHSLEIIGNLFLEAVEVTQNVMVPPT